MPDYITEPSEDVLERIADAQWSLGSDWVRKTQYGVSFLEIHQHNACNHTLSGTVDVDGVQHGFIIDSGDWNGTVIRSWGDPEEVGTYDPGPPPERKTFVPSDGSLCVSSPLKFAIYLGWRRDKKFKDMEQGYNYDRHFAPGGKTESYYANWGDTRGYRGLTPGYLSSFPKEVQRIIQLSDAGQLSQSEIISRLTALYPPIN